MKASSKQTKEDVLSADERSERIGRTLFELEQLLRQLLPVYRQVRISLLTMGSLPPHVEKAARENISGLISTLRNLASLCKIEGV